MIKSLTILPLVICIKVLNDIWHKTELISPEKMFSNDKFS